MAKVPEFARWVFLPIAVLASFYVFAHVEFFLFALVSVWSGWRALWSFSPQLIFFSAMHLLFACLVVRAGVFIVATRTAVAAWATFVCFAPLAACFALTFSPDPSYEEMATVVGPSKAWHYVVEQYAMGWVPFLSAIGGSAVTATRLSSRSRVS